MSWILRPLLAGGFAATVTAVALAEPTNVVDLSIDQLMQMEVTTAAKKQQKLAETPSAVYVMSSDDIRRSGATTLPELLLTVPGVDGGLINSHTAALSIRGLGGQWSNKLLVLVDGASIYTRTFSGVYWDSYNLPFEDIERIEVIRGPNAALWGANAVNGVINIITKPAGTTQGTLLRATAGTRGSGDLMGRHGFALGSQGFARVYASGEQHSEGELHAAPRGAANDDWKARRAGFRADWVLDGGHRLTVNGDAFHLDTHADPLNSTNLPTGVLPIGSVVDTSAESSGNSLMFNYTHAYAVTSEWSVQLYWKHSERGEFAPLAEDSLDLDIQHRFQPLPDHDLVWGMNTRYRTDETEGVDQSIRFAPEDTTDTHASLFFQDEISMADNALRVSVGSRFEHDEYNGWEVQPSLRGLWNINDDHKVWAAVSRSARTPSRIDRDIQTRVQSQMELAGLGTVPALIGVRGNRDFKSETVLARELGYRLRASDSWSFDLALFDADYDDLRSVTLIGYQIGPDGLIVDATLNNTIAGSVRGGELTANWVPTANLRLQAYWSELRMNLHDRAAINRFPLAKNYEGSTPERQLGLRSDWDLAPLWALTLQLKYVDELQQPFNYALLGSGKIDDYVDADLRLGYQPLPAVELALIGKNLLDGARLEYSSESGATLTETRRAAYLRVTWSF